MIKMLVLQQRHGLSDPELERQANDLISFRQFTDKTPDQSTIRAFRERISESGKDSAIWDEPQRQLDNIGLKITKSVIQDATFIHSEPGHTIVDTPRGEQGNR